jgi:hypothetical protein
MYEPEGWRGAECACTSCDLRTKPAVVFVITKLRMMVRPKNSWKKRLSARFLLRQSERCIDSLQTDTWCKNAKTINSRYSLVVTHPTTNLPAHGLSTAERTGSPVVHVLWSIAKDSVKKADMSFVEAYRVSLHRDDIHKKMPTYHGFHANWLHKAVDDMRKRMRAHLCSSDAVWIPVHALFPVAAYCLECRESIVAAAPVVDEVFCTCSHFRQYLCSRVFASSIHICSDGRPDGVDDVEGECQDGCIGERLEVLRDQGGSVGILFDEAE